MSKRASRLGLVAACRKLPTLFAPGAQSEERRRQIGLTEQEPQDVEAIQARLSKKRQATEKSRGPSQDYSMLGAFGMDLARGFAFEAGPADRTWLWLCNAPITALHSFSYRCPL